MSLKKITGSEYYFPIDLKKFGPFFKNCCLLSHPWYLTLAAARILIEIPKAGNSTPVSVSRIGDLSPMWGFSGAQWGSFFSSGDRNLR